MSSQRKTLSSPWMGSAQRAAYPALTSDRRVDVVIIGGGVMGITAAYLLKLAGRTVAVVERDRCGQGETGRSAAHLTALTDLSPTRLVGEFGPERAEAIWDAGSSAIARIRANVRDERINCGFGWVPGWLHAAEGTPRDRARADMRREADVAVSLGIDAQYVDRVPGMGRPAVQFEGQARIEPASYLDVLTSRIPGDGSYVFEHSEVEAVEDTPLAVRVGAFRLRTDYVIGATHAPFTPVIGGVPSTLLRMSLRSHVTYAVSGFAPARELPEGLYWEDVPGVYEYLRVDRFGDRDHVILGGRDHRATQAVDLGTASRELEARAHARTPGMIVDHVWCGHIIESIDGLPFMGEPEPRRFAATGFGGNGMTFGTLAGMMAADRALGRDNPWTGLFDINRVCPSTREPRRTHNDYVYELIRDGFTTPEAPVAPAADGTELVTPARHVARGEVVLTIS